MSPPAPIISPPAGISLYWTDKEILMSLDKFERGSPLPFNVSPDVNPFLYKPSYLPDEIWYYVCSEEKKDSELGFWKVRGETCEIVTDSLITGCRTTLDYYEGRAPLGRITDWVMQEYKITQKGLRNSSTQKNVRSLCRVFCSGELSSNQEMSFKQGGAASEGRNHSHSMTQAILKAGSSSGQGSKTECQVKNKDNEIELLPVVKRVPDPPVEIKFEKDCISVGDFLELDDLLDQESPSFSSKNSSFRSWTSDECFNSLALLQDLKDDNNQDLQGKVSASKYSVSASVRPNEVVMCPANLGSLISDNGSNLPVERTQSSSSSGKKSAVKSQKANHIKGTTNFSNVAASSSSNKPTTSDGKKKGAFGIMKKLKKYLCFEPF